jgi:hypothetical protein
VVPHDEQLAARLRAELGLVNLDAVALELPVQPTLGPDLLDELPKGNASAAIEIVISEARIDVWVADGITGKVLNRRLDLVSDPDQGDPRTVAIAAVELLRASRLEPGPTVEVVEVEPPTPATPDPSDKPSDLLPFDRTRKPVELPSVGAISLAPMVGGSPGGFGVTTHIEIAGRWAPTPRFALRVSAWIPALGNKIEVTDGLIRMFVGMAFVEPQLRLPGGIAWFHPELGLGLGGAVVGFDGTAREGLRNDIQVLGGFAGYGHVGLGFAVVPRLWLRLDGYVGTVQPRPKVKSIANVVEATWGSPFATGSVGLEIWL